jgi:hypothetical protein
VMCRHIDGFQAPKGSGTICQMRPQQLLATPSILRFARDIAFHDMILLGKSIAKAISVFSIEAVWPSALEQYVDH